MEKFRGIEVIEVNELVLNELVLELLLNKLSVLEESRETCPRSCHSSGIMDEMILKGVTSLKNGESLEVERN